MIHKILGSFRKSPAQALEVEASLPPPLVRLEKQCNLHCLRTESFTSNHPIRVATTQTWEQTNLDSDLEPEEPPPPLLPKTQLIQLHNRLQKCFGIDSEKGGPRGKIQRALETWKTPWENNFPATITIPELSKAEATKTHYNLLEEIQDPFFPEGPVSVCYTDGSKGTTENGPQTAAGLCEIGPEGETVRTGAWNTGLRAEVVDAEAFGVYKALVGALETQPPPKTLYIFVDSQAAIQRLHNPGNPTIQKAKGIVETLVRKGIRIYIV